MKPSDGSTPAKQTEQILAITPILPGQKPTERNRIPKRSESLLSIRSKVHSVANENKDPSSEQAQPPTHPQEPADLIDFGQNNSTSAQAPPTLTPLQHQIPNQNQERPAPVQLAPTDLHLAQTLNGGQKQKDLEDELKNTSVSPPPKGDALTNLEKDLKQDLPSVGNADVKEKKPAAVSLKKENTDDSDDEFMDAEG